MMDQITAVAKIDAEAKVNQVDEPVRIRDVLFVAGMLTIVIGWFYFLLMI